MSPSTLRRYRAERLLRREFGGLRKEVLANVRGRLRSRGVHLDPADLEASYAQAWQGLYAAIAAGEEIANPGGWLTLVTFRRAIDEHRSARARGFGDLAYVEPAGSERAAAGVAGAHNARTEPHLAAEPDLAAELDDRARLRHLFEALRSRLSARECEAASLCYLQGLTRAQAAQRMGISEARMVKLMEGAGPTRPGVAGKVGELLEAIRGGEWCEQQGSLMRGLAFGILDPGGERYRLALLHQRECPACRAYILSLRGLAAVLPPLPLPWALGVAAHAASGAGAKAGAGTGAGAGAKAGAGTGAGAGAGAKAGAGTGAGAGAGTKAGAGTGAGAGPGASTGTVSAGAVSATGAAGGGLGGGWLLSGPMGAKLAVSCVLALSVGCVALTVAPHHADARHPRVHREAPARSVDLAGEDPQLVGGSPAIGGSLAGRSPTVTTHHASRAAIASTSRRVSARHAQREFGPEQLAGATGSTAPVADTASVTAHAASRSAGGTGDEPVGEPGAPTSPAHAAGPPTHAEREFGP